MRQLTLDEKISLKGILAPKVHGSLVKLDISHALTLWRNIFSSPISLWYKRIAKSTSEAGHTAWRKHSIWKPTPIKYLSLEEGLEILRKAGFPPSWYKKEKL